MNENVLLRLAVALSVFGIGMLFVLASVSEPAEIGIADIEKSEGKDVRLRGIVNGIRSFENLAVLDVGELRNVKVVVFDRESLAVGVGDNVVVEGEVREYKGISEIIATRVEAVPVAAS